MKRILFTALLLSCWLVGKASDHESRILINAGFLFPETINASVGYERDLGYGNNIAILGEIGNHWQHPTCHMFWKGYYWGGEALYKHPIKRFKNSLIRVYGGAAAGAYVKNFYLGAEAGFEYDYVFNNGWHFTITQKNSVNFFHGDTFKNGLMIGIKIPL